jgi:hypothetical protein
VSVLNKIAYFQNRRDEVPNQQLARELAETKNRKGIREIAENLWNKNKNVQSDCLKVLYEIGYINPELVADYVQDFLKLLKSKNNRLVWGAMIALATIAEKRPREIWRNIDDVIDAVEHGSLITVVWGVKTLARVAHADKRYCKKIFPILMRQLKKCLPRDVPMHAESILCTVDKSNEREFLSILDRRRREMNSPQLTRLRRILRKLGTESEREE